MTITATLYEHMLFIRKFVQQGTRIASFGPSSKTLARELCRYINPKIPQVILELGAGTGAVTAVALKKMHPDSTLISIEQDAEFANYLKVRCPKAHVLVCDAKDMLTHIHALGFQHVDVIMNALPTPSLPESVVTQIFEQCQALMKENIPISQITLMPWVYLKMYQRVFTQVKFKLILKSMLPGGVYHCWGFK